MKASRKTYWKYMDCDGHPVFQRRRTYACGCGHSIEVLEEKSRGKHWKIAMITHKNAPSALNKNRICPADGYGTCVVIEGN
jgi:hypothetical protein